MRWWWGCGSTYGEVDPCRETRGPRLKLAAQWPRWHKRPRRRDNLVGAKNLGDTVSSEAEGVTMGLSYNWRWWCCNLEGGQGFIVTRNRRRSWPSPRGITLESNSVLRSADWKMRSKSQNNSVGWPVLNYINDSVYAEYNLRSTAYLEFNHLRWINKFITCLKDKPTNMASACRTAFPFSRAAGGLHTAMTRLQ
jgi:hypothetical protein